MAVSRMTEEVGRVLGGRYRIVAPIGRGASAQVFLADDVRLRRRVAVKMLHPALADDDAFLRRFRAEAQAAAALNHPHVMAVFDWGQDEEAPFLVTEYLAGGSLRSLLDQDHRLSLSQALLVGLEAARGLEYAHRRGFVHRDIKPANLLFGDEGRLRIADFGLARALAEAAWTEPQGAVLGTARYASPEQAQGQVVTGKADVYSLALVLVEAVTGEVPFASDTTIGTLMARVDRPLEVPGELGRLAPVLARAGSADPDDRIDAHALVGGLMATAEDLPRPARLPLAGVGEPGDLAVDADPTETGLLEQSVETAADVANPVPDEDEPDPAAGEDQPRRRRWPWLIAVLAVFVVVAGAIALLADSAPTHAVPRLAGVPADEAGPRVAEFDWDIEVTRDRSDEVDAGAVITTEPGPGDDLAEGDTLTLVVSDGPATIPVPDDLAGQPRADAEATLRAIGLRPRVTVAFSEEVDDGLVIGVAENTPGRVDFGGAVELMVSDGPEPRTIPDQLAGAPADDVIAALEGLGLVVDRQEDYDESIPAGVVIRTNPDPGAEVERGATVAVLVSLGPRPVPVPDVAGAGDLEAAAALLEQSGFVAGEVRGPARGRPVGTDPGAGTEVQPGTAIDIILG